MNPLDKFGNILIRSVRDQTFNEYLMIKDGKIKSETAKRIHDKIKHLQLTDDSLLDAIIIDIIDRELHNLLFMFDSNEEFSITSNNSHLDLAKDSDGLAGELYSQNGWIHRFSNFPESEITS